MAVSQQTTSDQARNVLFGTSSGIPPTLPPSAFYWLGAGTPCGLVSARNQLTLSNVASPPASTVTSWPQLVFLDALSENTNRPRMNGYDRFDPFSSCTTIQRAHLAHSRITTAHVMLSLAEVVGCLPRSTNSRAPRPETVQYVGYIFGPGYSCGVSLVSETGVRLEGRDQLLR